MQGVILRGILVALPDSSMYLPAQSNKTIGDSIDSITNSVSSLGVPPAQSTGACFRILLHYTSSPMTGSLRMLPTIQTADSVHQR